jgi:catechol 2,3-dioxygenase
MSYRPKYLAHVNLYVRDADASMRWYQDVLGLHVYEHRPGKAAFMSADLEQSHEVAVMQLGPEAEGYRKGQIALNHLAFRMESIDDLKEIYARLKAKGVTINTVVDHGISLGVYFQDPDGHGIEVYYELPRTEWPRQDQVFSVPRAHIFRGPWDADGPVKTNLVPA